MKDVFSILDPYCAETEAIHEIINNAAPPEDVRHRFIRAIVEQGTAMHWATVLAAQLDALWEWVPAEQVEAVVDSVALFSENIQQDYEQLGDEPTDIRLSRFYVSFLFHITSQVHVVERARFAVQTMWHITAHFLVMYSIGAHAGEPVGAPTVRVIDLRLPPHVMRAQVLDAIGHAVSSLGLGPGLPDDLRDVIQTISSQYGRAHRQLLMFGLN